MPPKPQWLIDCLAPYQIEGSPDLAQVVWDAILEQSENQGPG